MITVVTGIFGGYDTLKEPPPQSIDVEFVCVTDDPNLTSEHWKVYHQPANLVHPRLHAKLPKCVPWLWVGRGPVIWADASFTFRSTYSIARLMEVTSVDPASAWQFIHPGRDCIYTEAEFSEPLPKYRDQPIRRQAAEYRECGHSEHWGLWATGLIVYPEWSWSVQERGMRWLTEQFTWTNQDQISQPYVWRLYGSRPRELPGSLLSNEFVELHPHLDGT